MSNLIQYIIQDDPEEEMKKKQSQSLLSREVLLKKILVKTINSALDICWKMIFHILIPSKQPRLVLI